MFPTKWKSTGHGISAAAGKAGAIIGAFGFLFASQPALGEMTWKFPCENSELFEYTTFAKSAGASATLGAVVQVTAYKQNLAVPGFPYVQSSVGLVKPPWKNSLIVPAGTTAAAYVASLDPSYTTSNYAVGTAMSGVAPDVHGVITVSNVTYSLYYSNPSATGASPEGITNPQSYGFPQVGINGKSIGSHDFFPAGSSACLIKPICPGGLIATPAANNGKASYQCVCPIPTPLSGCFSYGIGIQGALGVLAATNFLGMLFTVLVPETNGKTLEQLNGEQEDDGADVELAEQHEPLAPAETPAATA